jgi:hypothetical protein
LGQEIGQLLYQLLCIFEQESHLVALFLDEHSLAVIARNELESLGLNQLSLFFGESLVQVFALVDDCEIGFARKAAIDFDKIRAPLGLFIYDLAGLLRCAHLDRSRPQFRMAVDDGTRQICIASKRFLLPERDCPFFVKVGADPAGIVLERALSCVSRRCCVANASLKRQEYTSRKLK